MNGHVVVVDLLVEEGALADFLPLLDGNARASLAHEPGCHRFDVCQDPDEPASILLYELYTDEAAFAAHLASAHFRAFDRQTAAMVRSKTVRQLALRAG